ncbi:MAG TPA: glycoside hydrolase family 3 N-terminal domain-containing protein [Gemmatimonadaceae bacterium]|nr:glycoside hydrolase family 3 N-terminal domain-containing protein [Gemmatimonadaceae bacterium]
MNLTRRGSLLMLLGAAASCAPAVRSASTSTMETPARMPAVGNVDPRSPLTDVQRRWVDSTLATLSLRERVGQMVWRWVLGDYANVDDSSFANARTDVVDNAIGGITMSLGSPIEVAAKINALQRLAKVPLIVSSDLEPNLGRLEGGVFSHYLSDGGGATVLPNAMAIGATGRDEDARDAARIIAREAKAVGITVNFAPTVDVNNNPANPVINVRSFGEDPAHVARLSSLFVRGTQEEGVIATAKHFPGHGDTDVDSHLGLPVVGATRARLDSVELVPFRAAIDAGVGMIMTAHLALPAVQGDSTTPATLAPRILTGMLRDTLRFGGVTVTDALTMEGVGKGYTQEQSAVQAVQAGAEILLMPRDAKRAIDAVVAAVEKGEVPRERIDRAARRVLEMKARTGAAFQRYRSMDEVRAVVGSPAHRRTSQEIAQRAVTLLKDQGNLVPITPTRVMLVQYAPETELRAGRYLPAELRTAGVQARAWKVGPRTSPAELDSIARAVRGAERVVIAAYVRRIEGEGRNAIPAHIAAWADSLAASEKVVFIALGNPYLIRQVPRVGTYLMTYSVNEVAERAAARAITGKARITGKTPVGLPGVFPRGAGLQR